MIESTCSDVVRFGGDLGFAPAPEQESLATHVASCEDCARFVSQIADTRDLLARMPARDGSQRGEYHASDAPQGLASTVVAASLRGVLLARAELLDPANAEDLTQRSVEIGLALERRDGRPRTTTELTQIMHTLSDAQARIDGYSTPAADATAADRARAASLEDLDSDSDESELFYPDLYPAGNELEGWIDSPNEWRGGTQVLSPEDVEETGEVYSVLDDALSELPEPLGELLALVDLQGHALPDSAQVLGLDEPSGAAALARARNHVRGRLDEYLKPKGK